MPGEFLETEYLPTYADVFPVPEFIKPFPGTENMARDKMNSKEELSIVYFGDSVTAGGDVEPSELMYTNRLSDYLVRRYPSKNFHFHNSAIGGTNSSYGRRRFEKDVLKHQPDIVAIMFELNDSGLVDKDVLDNHLHFITELRKIEAVTVFLTSNLMTKTWLGRLDNANRLIVDFCRKHKVPLVDTYSMWQALGDYSIPYEAVLANGINHPDAVSHGLFFEGLKFYF